jgi:hypothetical protein
MSKTEYFLLFIIIFTLAVITVIVLSLSGIVIYLVLKHFFGQVSSIYLFSLSLLLASIAVGCVVGFFGIDAIVKVIKL